MVFHRSFGEQRDLDGQLAWDWLEGLALRGLLRVMLAELITKASQRLQVQARSRQRARLAESQQWERKAQWSEKVARLIRAPGARAAYAALASHDVGQPPSPWSHPGMSHVSSSDWARFPAPSIMPWDTRYS